MLQVVMEFFEHHCTVKGAVGGNLSVLWHVSVPLLFSALFEDLTLVYSFYSMLAG